MIHLKEEWKGVRMKIIEIIKHSAELLGLDNERDLLEAGSSSTEDSLLENKEIKKLFNLIKFSIQELCTHYVPVCTSQEISTTNKRYPLSNLNNYVRLINVSKDGQTVKFKIINRNLEFSEDSTYTVNYMTYPTIDSMYDEIDFLSNFSSDALVFGLCAYYCLTSGMFEDFDSFYDKYITKAESLKDLKIFELPARRWE